MIPIFICDACDTQRKKYKRIVENYLFIEDKEMSIIETNEPEEIISYLKSNPETSGVYFLDMNFDNDLNGIQLASKIREFDPYGAISFVTDRLEMMYLTFTYKLEVMDFILKEESDATVAQRICDVLALVYSRYLTRQATHQKMWQVKIDGKIKMIPYKEVMFIETTVTPHMLLLHLENESFEFRGAIRELALDDMFFRCHKSAVVNLNNIKSVNLGMRKIEMINGQICDISAKALRELRILEEIKVS